jgi:hypothetical protein
MRALISWIATINDRSAASSSRSCNRAAQRLGCRSRSIQVRSSCSALNWLERMPGSTEANEAQSRKSTFGLYFRGNRQGNGGVFLPLPNRYSGLRRGWSDPARLGNARAATATARGIQKANPRCRIKRGFWTGTASGEGMRHSLFHDGNADMASQFRCVASDPAGQWCLALRPDLESIMNSGRNERRRERRSPATEDTQRGGASDSAARATHQRASLADCGH